jgi:hypothetical protein
MWSYYFISPISTYRACEPRMLLVRRANRNQPRLEALFITEGDEGIGSGGAAGGEETSGEARRHDKRHSGGECSCIRG